MKANLRYLTRIGFIGLFVIFTCLGCTGVGQKLDKWGASVSETVKDGLNFGDSESSNDAKRKNSGDYCKECYRHTVRWPGESLSLIARWYTGSSRNWRKLAKANPRIDPNCIKKGNVITISPKLLKTREQLPQKLAARYTADYFAYTVRQNGEKMEVIANWYTGNATNWKAIARVNPKLDPNHLVAGNEIYIPSKILKTRQPIPESPPATTGGKPKPEPATVEKTMIPEEEEEIKIFGPKQFPKS